MQGMSFTRRTGLRHPRQSSHREDHHIGRNARIQLTASSASIQALVAASIGAPVSSRTIRRHLAEGLLGSRFPLHMLPSLIDVSVWSNATHKETGLPWNGSRSSLAMCVCV
ncbi:HTH_Tnp_Tc3_2 domain-containing protein [Trichonephila clavipes]|nr:HTH_Tnp_Tc3_2 domain-containing protein [Trichonephila clavipes]